MVIKRFNIRRDTIWKAPLLIIGATENNSYVEIREEDIVVRFGVHESRIQISDILSSNTIEWPIWNGIGIRISFGKTLGLVGSLEGVVALDIKNAESVHFLGIKCSKIAFSLEDPEGFLDAISKQS